jgi:hypothetical protein
MIRHCVSMRAICVGLLSALLVVAAGPALAGKPDHAGGPGNGNKGQGGGKPPKASKSNGGSHSSKGYDDPIGVSRFSSSQRDAYFDWYHDSYGASCPPGLAKKNNGCMPPGLAKKQYRIGYPLPPGIVLGPLPSALAILLGAPPVGYRYGILDGDVVKLAIGTALVVDAIEGLTSR